MAGLYDRITAQEDKINIHYIVAGLKGYGTGKATRVQVRDAINTDVTNPMTAAEEADFNAIADELDAQLNATAKLGYVNQVEYAMIAAGSLDALNDAQWRSALDI
jgi:hypothetical protein